MPPPEAHDAGCARNGVREIARGDGVIWAVALMATRADYGSGGWVFKSFRARQVTLLQRSPALAYRRAGSGESGRIAAIPHSVTVLPKLAGELAHKT